MVTTTITRDQHCESHKRPPHPTLPGLREQWPKRRSTEMCISVHAKAVREHFGPTASKTQCLQAECSSHIMQPHLARAILQTPRSREALPTRGAKRSNASQVPCRTPSCSRPHPETPEIGIFAKGLLVCHICPPPMTRGLGHVSEVAVSASQSPVAHKSCVFSSCRIPSRFS